MKCGSTGLKLWSIVLAGIVGSLINWTAAVIGSIWIAIIVLGYPFSGLTRSVRKWARKHR